MPIINYFGTLGKPYGLNLRCYWEQLGEHLRNLRTIWEQDIYIYSSPPLSKRKKLDRSQVHAEPSHWLHEIPLSKTIRPHICKMELRSLCLDAVACECLLLRVWHHPTNFCCAC